MRITSLLMSAMLLVGLPLCAPAKAEAQCQVSSAPGSCAQPGTVSLTAGRVVRLQVDAGSTSLTAPTPADFDAGFNSTTGPTLTVSANAPWMLQVRAVAASWTASNTSPGVPARTNKPAADLKWATSAAGPFSALGTTDVTLVSGSATASSATTLYFRTLYSWTSDTPGNYSLSVVLTLTAP